ncbi:MAG: hypothetical protein PVH50_07700 [Anaerolineae bacterium]
MDCAHLPAIHRHSKLWGILAFSRDQRAPTVAHAAPDLWHVWINCQQSS